MTGWALASHTIAAAASTIGGELKVKTATLEMDESWSPYCQASLVCTIPDAALLATIDPRNAGARIYITISQTSDPYDPNTTPRSRTFNLGIRARRIDHNAGELTLTLSSDEALLQDYARVATTNLTPAYTSARTAVANALAAIGATLQAGTADASIDPESSVWIPGTDAWSYLQPIVQAANLRLWCDEQRRWFLTVPNQVTPGYAQLDYVSTITTVSDSIERDAGNWYDAVVVEYRWTDSGGVDHVLYDVASKTGFSKVLSLSYETKRPATGAAARILKRVSGKGRQLEIRAISDYGVTPGMPAAVTMPDTPLITGAVSAVRWNFPADEMDVTTRDLIDAPTDSWVSTPGGVAWSDIEAGISWNEYSLVGVPTEWEHVAVGETWALVPVGVAWTEYEGA